MANQVIIGSILIILSLVTHALFMVSAVLCVQKLRWWLFRPPHFLKLIITFSAISAWLLISMSLSAVIWALNFIWSGAFTSYEESLYFSLVSFTTLGFGDVILGIDHRIQAGLLAANGLIQFGLTTAILIEIIHRLYRDQIGDRESSGA